MPRKNAQKKLKNLNENYFFEKSKKITKYKLITGKSN